MDSPTLKPASELARASKVHFPNESAEYRRDSVRVAHFVDLD